VTCNNVVITTGVNGFASATAGTSGSAQYDIRNSVAPIEAYYTTVVRSADQAGNLSQPQQRTFLYDLTPPVVGGVGFPASLDTRPSPVFTSSATDNVDLLGIGIRFSYASTNGQPALTVGDTAASFKPIFDSTRVTDSGLISYQMGGPGGFIRQIWQQAPGDLAPPAGTPPAGTQVQSVTVRAVDAARNGSPAPGNTAAIPAGNVTVSPIPGACPAPPAAATAGCYDSFMVTEPGAAVTVSNPPANPGGGSVTLAASIKGRVSSVTSPFSVVCFYYENNGAGEGTFPGILATDWVRIGCQQLGDVTDAGDIRTWTYRTSWNPDAALGPVGPIRVRAFGFSQANPGVVTATQPIGLISLVP